MLHLKNFIKVGFIRKTHGHRGECKIVVDDPFEEELGQQSFVFLDIDGCMIPFEIESLKFQKDVVLKLRELDSPEAIKELDQKDIFLLAEGLKVVNRESDKLKGKKEWIGYKLSDLDKGLVGTIHRVEEYPQQLMAIVVDADENEILIPLNESLIVEIVGDEITMDLPEGLV